MMQVLFIRILGFYDQVVSVFKYLCYSFFFKKIFTFFLYFYRLWDLGQQRCVHSYAVHTDSVWALASTPTFSHVYSGGRDLSVSPFFLIYFNERK